jgi:hypothetical protein
VLARIATFAIDGVDPRHVFVEVDIRSGLPAFRVVGLADAAVREARERVRAALLNLDVPGRETIMPWSGVRFDTAHQNSDAAGVVEQRVKGLFHVVFPGELQPQQAAEWPLSKLRKG